MNQLKYRLKKNENALIKTWVNIRDESIFVMNEYNKKIVKFEEFITDYNNCIDELNDVKLIIRELKMKLREKNLKIRIHSYLSSKTMWLFLRSRNSSIHSSSLTIKIQSSTIDCQSCATRWKIMRIDFLQTFNKTHTYESELMMMLWSIWFFVFSRTRLSRTRSQMKSLMICIKYSTIRIVVLTLWKLIVAWSRSNRLKISTSSELNFSDWRAILSCIIKRHFSKDLKNKMSYELQKVLVIESYKVIDLHEFVKMCRYTDQTLKDVVKALFVRYVVYEIVQLTILRWIEID
jgi:hypothetical protein